MNLNKKLEMELKNNLKGIYGLEITTTQACNFQCSYCFERNHVPEENLLNPNIITKRVKQLLDSNWFKEQYSGIKIILWGGEPTMNMPLCKSLMEIFRQDERVCFFVYTNGSTIDNLMPTLLRLKKQPFIKDNQSKITIQVSYDGNPTHDMNRRDRKGNKTTYKAIHAITELHKYGIDYGLKATMSWKDFKYLPECWDDFKSLHNKFGSKIKYSLTVDYYNVEFSKYKDIVEKVLIKVAQKEVEFFKEYRYFLSNIFRGNKAICATGKNMACIDTDGIVYNCHGAIYSKCSDDLQYANIFDKDFINSIQRANSIYANNNIEPDECKECISSSCLRCNVKKYEESKKETHLDRWYDYPAQKDLCKYYKLVGKISAAIGSILKRE
jgi:uncharacterized protein